MKYIHYLILFLILSQVKVFSQWQHPVGLYGGDVREVKTDANNNFYAVTGGNEIYISTNNGGVWYPSYTGLPVNKSIRNIAINSGHIFAGGIGINVSTNFGQSWSPVTSGLPPDPGIISIYANDTWVFADVDDPDGIYKSSNNGVNWILSNSPRDTTARLLGIINGNVYARITNGGLYKSTNYGVTWNPINNGLLPPSDWYSLLTQGNNKIFLNTLNGLYATTNEGSSWSSTSFSNYSYAFTTSGNNIYASGSPDYYTVFYSSDNGLSWSDGHPGLHQGAVVSSLSRNNTTLAAGSRTDGVYISDNNGLNWSYASSGITASNCHEIVIDNNNIYALTYERGVNLSTDNGLSWSVINSNLPTLFQPQTIGAHGNFLITASQNFGVYISTNHGSSWAYSYTPNSTDDFRGFIVADDTVFAAGFGGIYISSNSGTNWTSINNGLPTNPYVNTILKINQTIFAGINNHGVYASTNSGTLWYPVSNGLSGSAILELKSAGNNIIALSVTQGIFLSSDYGALWRNITSNIQGSTINSADIKGNNIFAASGYGLYVSNDLGVTWHLANTGLTALTLNTIAVSDNFIFPGVENQSVWRRPLSEVIGIKPVSSVIPGEYKLNQNYPNPFNPTTEISFDIPETSFTEITIYDISGREIETILKTELNRGSYRVRFDGGNLSSGIYFYRIESHPAKSLTGDFKSTKKMVLIK